MDSATEPISFQGTLSYTPIPIPPGTWLFGSGLVVLLGFRKNSGRFGLNETKPNDNACVGFRDVGSVEGSGLTTFEPMDFER